MRLIDVDLLSILIESDEDCLLVDLLPEHEYAQEHIPGAINAPLESPDFVNLIEAVAVDKDQAIVLYAEHDGSDDALDAAERLRALGFANLVGFEGGLRAWKSAGLPVASVVA